MMNESIFKIVLGIILVTASLFSGNSTNSSEDAEVSEFNKTNLFTSESKSYSIENPEDAPVLNNWNYFKSSSDIKMEEIELRVAKLVENMKKKTNAVEADIQKTATVSKNSSDQNTFVSPFKCDIM